MYGRKPQNSVKQLSFNLKNEVAKKKKKKTQLYHSGVFAAYINFDPYADSRYICRRVSATGKKTCTYFNCALRTVTAAMKLKDTYSYKKLEKKIREQELGRWFGKIKRL